MKKLDVLAAILVVVGAINWGLVAVAHFDLVAGIYQAASFKSIQRRWHGEPALQHSR